MIRAIAIIYIFFILCDIQLTVENYFQKIGSPPPPLKKSTPRFYSLPPKTIPKVQVPLSWPTLQLLPPNKLQEKLFPPSLIEHISLLQIKMT